MFSLTPTVLQTSSPSVNSSNTRVFAAVPEPVLEKIVAKIPVGRLGQADEIARGVAFLTSDEGGFVTGSTMSINGGQHMY